MALLHFKCSEPHSEAEDKEKRCRPLYGVEEATYRVSDTISYSAADGGGVGPDAGVDVASAAECESGDAWKWTEKSISLFVTENDHHTVRCST